MRVRPAVHLFLAALLVLPVKACAAGADGIGPTGLDDVCAAYVDLARVYDGPNSIPGREVFTALAELGEVATRYPDDPDIGDAGPKIAEMAERDSLDPLELSFTVAPIMIACNDRAA
ncbi:hypothetical protein EDD29_8544 [Actinocorallia herbida]|uniref:Uncharacterized protein n=1 Tax=Actinocorallia herbida TaxID=58109 RepID=A0A3N1DBA8_9ACTN|nr:hypothetical protein [Actinocorallia herbida]ROO90805.1 hypothetical protein EDD29_8544 [Actinocorallia herbida]